MNVDRRVIDRRVIDRQRHLTPSRPHELELELSDELELPDELELELSDELELPDELELLELLDELELELELLEELVSSSNEKSSLWGAIAEA